MVKSTILFQSLFNLPLLYFGPFIQNTSMEISGRLKEFLGTLKCFSLSTYFDILLIISRLRERPYLFDVDACILWIPLIYSEPLYNVNCLRLVDVYRNAEILGKCILRSIHEKQDLYVSAHLASLGLYETLVLDITI